MGGGGGGREVGARAHTHASAPQALGPHPPAHPPAHPPTHPPTPARRAAVCCGGDDTCPLEAGGGGGAGPEGGALAGAAPTGHPPLQVGRVCVRVRVCGCGGGRASPCGCRAITFLPPPATHTLTRSAAVAALHGDLYVVGGNVGAGVNENCTGVECWCAAAGRWRPTAPLSAGRSGLAAAPV